jgi:hypothetical protein
MSDDAVTKGPTKTRARRRRDGAGGGPAEPVCGAYAWRPRVRRHLQARGVRRQRRLCPRTTATTTVMVTRQGRRSAAMEMPRAEGGQGAGVAGAGEGDGGGSGPALAGAGRAADLGGGAGPVVPRDGRAADLGGESDEAAAVVWA